MDNPRTQPARIALRRAVQGDAPAIAAVFDAAVGAGWTYLGDLVAAPLFTPEDWEQVVADHRPPNLLLVAVDDTERVVGYTAVHPEDGEVVLLFVHPDVAGRGIGRTLLAAAHDALRAAGCTEAFLFTHEQNRGRWPCTRLRDTVRTVPIGCRTSAEYASVSYGSSSSFKQLDRDPTRRGLVQSC